MDREIIAQKLESLRKCLIRIETKCPANVEVLIADLDIQDIITLNLSRAVQICVDIGAHMIAGMEIPPPDTMGQTFDILAQQGILDNLIAANLKKAVGFRNIAIHNYDKINWDIVHNIALYHLSDFDQFARVIALKEGM